MADPPVATATVADRERRMVMGYRAVDDASAKRCSTDRVRWAPMTMLL